MQSAPSTATIADILERHNIQMSPIRDAANVPPAVLLEDGDDVLGIDDAPPVVNGLQSTTAVDAGDNVSSGCTTPPVGWSGPHGTFLTKEALRNAADAWCSDHAPDTVLRARTKKFECVRAGSRVCLYTDSFLSTNLDITHFR